MIAAAGPQRVVQIDWLACAAVAGLAIAAYLPALDNGFSLDDYNFIERVRFAPNLAVFLVQPEPGELISPVAEALLIALYRGFGLDPKGWHATLLALHALNAALVYLVGARLCGDRTVALLAASLFAAAASGSEAIFWVAAYSHPLTTALYLGTLLLFLRHLDTGSRAALWGALALFAAGLLAKATFYSAWAALLVVVFARDDPERGRYRSMLPFTILLLVALAANIVFAIRDSYLIERGIYAAGWHVATNLAAYAARIAFPFRALLARIGMAAAYGPLLTTLAVAVPAALIAVLVLGDRRARTAIALMVLALIPVLPFVYRPTSRYVYLATAGWAWLVALALVGAMRRRGWSMARLVWIVPLLAAPHLAEIKLVDHEYEYRERLMAQLVADVREIYPTPPSGGTITVLELPNFAIDRAIHLEAALRLAYDTPALTLIAPDPGATTAGDALVYVDGRIHPRSNPDR